MEKKPNKSFSSLLFTILLALFFSPSILIFSVLLLGCKRNPERQTLLAAEKMMEANPDSALKIIGALNPEHLNKADLSLYALLDAQARYKLYLPAPSDSLLNVAVDYYSHHGPDSLLMKTLFLRATGDLEAGDLIAATNDATLARELASAMKGNEWKAKTADLISDIYEADSNMTEEATWLARAAKEYKLAGQFENHLFALCDLIWPLTDMGQPKKAMALVDSLRPVVEAHPEIPLLGRIFYMKAVPPYSVYGDTRTAQALLDSLNAKSGEEELPFPFPAYQARVNTRRGDIAGAREIIEQNLPLARNTNDSIFLMWEYAKTFAGGGDYKKAYEYLDSVVALQYRVFHQTTAHSITATQRNLYEDKYSKETKRADRQQSFILILITALCLLVVVVVAAIWIIRRNAKRKLQLDLKEIQELRDEMSRERMISVESEMQEIRQKIELQKRTQETLYRQKWEMLNKLCFELNPDKRSMDENERITANLRKYIESLRDTSHFKEIEDSIDLYMDGIMKRMREQCDFLNEKDFIFLTLLYAGHSAKTISFFTGIRLSYFYTKRDRLYARIMKSEAPDKEEFGRRIKES